MSGHCEECGNVTCFCPKEFWIQKTRWGHGDAFGVTVRDQGPFKDHIHVIEYSAYEDMKQERDEWKRAAETRMEMVENQEYQIDKLRDQLKEERASD